MKSPLVLAGHVFYTWLIFRINIALLQTTDSVCLIPVVFSNSSVCVFLIPSHPIQPNLLSNVCSVTSVLYDPCCRQV